MKLGPCESYDPKNKDHNDPEKYKIEPGTVWDHTLLCVDAAVKYRNLFKDPKDKITFMLSILLHDMGKPETTENKEGRITSYGHDVAGAEIARQFLNRLTDENDLLERVPMLVGLHMSPTNLYDGKAKDSAIRRLAKKVDIPMLVALSMSDKEGRDAPTDLKAERWLLSKYKNLKLEQPETLEPKVKGRHLIPLGIEPGPEMGRILNRIYDAQLEGKFETTEQGLDYAKQQGWLIKGFFNWEMDKSVQVKGFTRTRKGKLERVKEHTRAGQQGVVPYRKKEGDEWEEGWKESVIKIAPKGKMFRIYRGDAATVDPKTGKLLGFRWKEGKTLYTSRPTSFSMSKKIAEEFAHGIAEHYNKEYNLPGFEFYTPVLITALAKKLKVSGFWGQEREVYPLRGKSKVKSIEVLPAKTPEKETKLGQELKDLKDEFEEKTPLLHTTYDRLASPPKTEAERQIWLKRKKVDPETEASLRKLYKKSLVVDLVKSRKGLVKIRKSKIEGKLIPYRWNNKVVWAKVLNDGVIVKGSKEQTSYGSSILVKSDIAKVTGIGKHGVVARTEDNKKYQVLYKDLNLWIKK